MTNEIATQDEGILLALPSADHGAEVVQRAMAASQSLANAVQQNKWFVDMSGKKYLEVEAWQFIGMVIGIDADIEYTKPITNDTGIVLAYESKAVLYRNGTPFSSGIMECGMDSFPTRGKHGRDKDKAAQSASQTWAVSKAYRNRLGFLAKMAGYESTPADEMRGDKEPTVGYTYGEIERVAPRKPSPVSNAMEDYKDGLFCPIHNMEWAYQPVPDNWAKTPEGRPTRRASHRNEDGTWCNMANQFRDELETSLGEGFQDFIFNMFKTTWSKLDPEQMDEARILASGSVSQEQELFGPDEDEEDQPF